MKSRPIEPGCLAREKRTLQAIVRLYGRTHHVAGGHLSLGHRRFRRCLTPLSCQHRLKTVRASHPPLQETC